MNNWDTILKYQIEEFDIEEYQNYNPICGDAQQMTSTPYVKIRKTLETIPDLFTGKEKEETINHRTVEIGNFTLKENPCTKPLTEKTWLEKSVNIFNTARVHRTTIVLEKNIDKLKLSIFKFNKSRNVGHRYFAKHSDDLHITFNFKTKNFFITCSNFVNRRRSTITTKNDFMKISTLLNTIQYESISDKDKNQANVIKFFKKVEKKLKEELKIKFDLSNLGEGLGEGIVKWFISQWKIKVPNNYYSYIMCHYPGIRKLRRHKMNLGRTILHNKGLYGKYYVKLINEEDTTYNLSDLKRINLLLGERYCKMVPKTFLRSTCSTQDSKHNLEINPHSNLGLTKYEKLNIIKLMSTTSKPTFLNLLSDHLHIKNKLKNFGMDVKIKSKNEKQFDKEHNQWADLIHLCERNKQTTYQYHPSFIKTMESPITLNSKKFEVTLLKTDLDYFNEGQHQIHCVRSYLDKYDSIIVSVRAVKGERMTLEFNYGNNKSIKDYQEPTLVQARMKFNKNPQGEWIDVMEKVKKRFNSFKNLKKPTIEIYNKLTGKKIVFDREKNENPPKDDIFYTRIGDYQNIMADDLPF